VSRSKKNMPTELKVPWITKDGYLDMTKFPIDTILSQALSDSRDEFANACRILSSMVSAGRVEAGIFLCGLLGHCGDDLSRKENIVEALGFVRTPQAAGLLFAELESTESSNSTRGYINSILKELEKFPLESVEEGFEKLLSDPKWTYRMKRKFREILEMIEYRRWRE
jgi:hypothetical protein